MNEVLFYRLNLIIMNVKAWILRTCRGRVDISYFLPTCFVPMSAIPFQKESKISKQSALAVQQLFRDNQHQSTGKFRSALA